MKSSGERQQEDKVGGKKWGGGVKVGVGAKV